jgi:hypothetical protein
MPMEIEVSNTIDSTGEAARLTRRRYYWLRIILSSAYHGYLLVPGAVIGWFGVRGLLICALGPERERTPLHVLVAAGAAAVPLIIAGLIGGDIRRERRAKQAMCGPLKFLLTEEGVSGIDLRGGTFTDAWSSLAGFHIAHRVIVLPKKASYVYMRIPIESLPVVRQQAVRALLLRHLPELSREGLRTHMRTRGLAE